MPLRPVPWAIGNGAENSVELARADTFVGSSGATGIVDPTDLHVKQTPVPSGAVRISRGTGVIRNTYPGAFGQSYVVQEQSFTDVPVAATGSSGGATKYVYVLIEDTQYGGQTPPSIVDGPYNDYAVTTTLPQNQPYLLLAKIAQPASTGTITNAMITDMREVAVPRRSDVWRPRASVREDTEELTAYQDGDGEWFPNAGGEQRVFIPGWATRVQVAATWMGVRIASGKNGFGEYWLEYGPPVRQSVRKYSTQRYQWDTVGTTATTYRESWLMEDDQPVPADIRGTEQPFIMKALRFPDSDNAAAMIDFKSGVSIKLRFLQVAEPSTT